MTDYCKNDGSSKFADTSTSRTESLNGQNTGNVLTTCNFSGANGSRIRVAKLVRLQSSNRRIIGQTTASFGFSIRGGKEFCTGFFISHVEKDSQAELKGLRAGDQIIRLNGFHVDDAVHRELSQFISNQDRITLKVRGAGMIPVKERSSDATTWHFVPNKLTSQNKTIPTNSSHTPTNSLIYTTLNVLSGTKLGLGICKGPDWKPGIFVQFTKEMSVAQEAGLRPGDQLVSCNGINFADISFVDAVATMKSRCTLELVIRPAIGLELFPGESSGYNSSASSSTEEQVPTWKSLENKKQPTQQHYTKGVCKLESFHNRVKSVTPPRIPFSNSKSNTSETFSTQKPNTTIINLSGNGVNINNTILPNLKNDNISNCSIVHIDPGNVSWIKSTENSLPNSTDIKTVKVDVHCNKTTTSESIPPPPPSNIGINNEPLSLTSSTSYESSDKSSFSNAISEAVKQRVARTQSGHNIQNSSKAVLNATKSSKILANSLIDVNLEKHNALMNEFKKAHQKMFKNNVEGGSCENHTTNMERRNKQHLSSCETDNVMQKISVGDKIDKVESNLRSFTITQQKLPSNTINCNEIETPPPTPAPDYDSSSSNTLKNNCERRTGNNFHKGTMARVAASEIAKANGAAAEMESIESFKLTNPSSPVPKPPPIYWAPQNCGPPTIKNNKSQRAASVTVGEYTNISHRKTPSKLDFISKPNEELLNITNSSNSSSGDNVSIQFKDELQKTLSRSNLKKCNDNTNNNFNNNVFTTQKNIDNLEEHKKNNLKKTLSNVENITVSLTQNPLQQLQQPQHKQQPHNFINHKQQMTSPENNVTLNKITISIPQSTLSNIDGLNSTIEKNYFTLNSILKTSSANNIDTINANGATEHKNIKFQNM